MTIAVLDAFSGISGDMTLGALLEVGLSADWLRALPGTLGLEGVSVRIQRVSRAGIGCAKVDFDIPPQPHGRHLSQIRDIVRRSAAPQSVRSRADATFLAIATVEGEVHGVPPEKVHLHEVGAVDAILDVVGAIWGFELLGISDVYCGPIALGDGTVRAAHGELPVPAPATLKLLEGHPVRPGPPGSGELVTPTGAALVRTLSKGPPPHQYVPRRSGFGAGAKDPKGRPNALRIVLADLAGSHGTTVESLVHLATDIDDLDGEYVAGVADLLREAGALDVVLVPTIMKKGRPGVRIEVLAPLPLADSLAMLLFSESSSLGVRRLLVERHAVSRTVQTVRIRDHEVRVKVAELGNGRRRAKPEYEDVARVAAATGGHLRELYLEALREAERLV